MIGYNVRQGQEVCLVLWLQNALQCETGHGWPKQVHFPFKDGEIWFKQCGVCKYRAQSCNKLPKMREPSIEGVFFALIQPLNWTRNAALVVLFNHFNLADVPKLRDVGLEMGIKGIIDKLAGIHDCHHVSTYKRWRFELVDLLIVGVVLYLNFAESSNKMQGDVANAPKSCFFRFESVTKRTTCDNKAQPLDFATSMWQHDHQSTHTSLAPAHIHWRESKYPRDWSHHPSSYYEGRFSGCWPSFWSAILAVARGQTRSRPWRVINRVVFSEMIRGAKALHVIHQFADRVQRAEGLL